MRIDGETALAEDSDSDTSIDFDDLTGYEPKFANGPYSVNSSLVNISISQENCSRSNAYSNSYFVQKREYLISLGFST